MSKIVQLYDTQYGSQQEATVVGSVSSKSVAVVSSKSTYFDAPVSGLVRGFKAYMTAGGGGATVVTLKDGGGNTIASTNSSAHGAPDKGVISSNTIDDDYNIVAKGDRLELLGGVLSNCQAWVEFEPS